MVAESYVSGVNIDSYAHETCLLSSMYGLQEFRDPLPRRVKLEIRHSRNRGVVRLIFSPIKQKNDVEQLSRERSDFVERKRVAGHDGGRNRCRFESRGGESRRRRREELVISHGEKGLIVQINEEE